MGYQLNSLSHRPPRPPCPTHMCFEQRQSNIKTVWVASRMCERLMIAHQTGRVPSSLHCGKVRGQIWTFLKLRLEVRWVLKNWGKTEAFRCFFTECKFVEIWLRYKHFSDPPNSKIIAGMLKNLAAHFCHCAVACRRRVIPFSVSPYKLDAIMECLRYRSAKSDAYFSFN